MKVLNDKKRKELDTIKLNLSIRQLNKLIDLCNTSIYKTQILVLLVVIFKDVYFFLVFFLAELVFHYDKIL